MKPILTLLVAFAMASVSTPSSALPLSSRSVLINCPDVAEAQACTALAGQFLADRSAGKRRDGQVIDLVIAIAEATQTLRVTGAACHNAAEGLRVLAAGITAGEQGPQITDIADSLCKNTRTASVDVGEAGASGSPSESGVSTGRTSAAQSTGVTTPSTCAIDCESEGVPTSSGGLGSNDAAKSPNQNAIDHANEHATDNANGQNGRPDGQGQDPGQSQGQGQGQDKDKGESGNQGKSEDAGQGQDLGQSQVQDLGQSQGQGQGQGQAMQDAASAESPSQVSSTQSDNNGNGKGADEPKGKPEK